MPTKTMATTATRTTKSTFFLEGKQDPRILIQYFKCSGYNPKLVCITKNQENFNSMEKTINRCQP